MIAQKMRKKKNAQKEDKKNQREDNRDSIDTSNT